jgi:drug/metabolite transporter (DMT)-like permease
MWDSVNSLQAVLLLLLGLGVLGLTGFALVDALRHRQDAFTAAGKLTKPIWCTILGVAVAIAIIKVRYPLDIFGIICVVAAGVYLADVRPALRNITGGSQGPYGRW